MTYASPTNVTSMMHLFSYVNMVTNFWFWPLMLAAFWFVCFIALKRYEMERALLGASTITVIIAILMRVINLINDFALIIFIALEVVSLLVKQFSGRDSYV